MQLRRYGWAAWRPSVPQEDRAGPLNQLLDTQNVFGLCRQNLLFLDLDRLLKSTSAGTHPSMPRCCCLLLVDPSHPTNPPPDWKWSLKEEKRTFALHSVEAIWCRLLSLHIFKHTVTQTHTHTAVTFVLQFLLLLLFLIIQIDPTGLQQLQSHAHTHKHRFKAPRLRLTM